jgi:ABC-type Na+ efflux pump permease subunit
MIPGVNLYVVAAIVVVGAVGYGAFEHQRYLTAKADLVAYQAQAEAETQKLRAKAAQVETKVVIQYRDRVKEIRVPEPVEVVREIERLRDSGCVLPGAFRLLHDSAATGASGETSTGTDESAPVPCDVAAETIRESYKRARENAEQLKALQEWAASVSAP